MTWVWGESSLGWVGGKDESLYLKSFNKKKIDRQHDCGGVRIEFEKEE